MRTTARASSLPFLSPPSLHVALAVGLFHFPFLSHEILSFGVDPCFHFKHRRSFRSVLCFPLLSSPSLDLPLCIQTFALRLCLHNSNQSKVDSK